MLFNSLSPSLHPLGHLWLVLVTYTCPYVVAQDDNGTAVSTVAPNLLLEEPLCGYSKRDLAFKAVESYIKHEINFKAIFMLTKVYQTSSFQAKIQHSFPSLITQITIIIPATFNLCFWYLLPAHCFWCVFFSSRPSGTEIELIPSN